MKVSTDGILFGAWAPLDQARSILDVGTGTGLLALMAAQRAPQAHITGLELDAAACHQARENAAASPWADRIDILQADFLRWVPPTRYDHILCNPPYFRASLKGDIPLRNQARHLGAEAWEAWLDRLWEVSTTGSGLSLIYPAAAKASLQAGMEARGWWARKRLDIHARAGAPAGRCLWHFSREAGPCQVDTLFIHTTGGLYSPGFRALTQAFYL